MSEDRKKIKFETCRFLFCVVRSLFPAFLYFRYGLFKRDCFLLSGLSFVISKDIIKFL